jgi:hypothetical protein
MGHLAYPHAGKAELPQVTARTSIRSVSIAQSYRTGVPRQPCQRNCAAERSSGVLDGRRIVSFSSARRAA